MITFVCKSELNIPLLENPRVHIRVRNRSNSVDLIQTREVINTNVFIVSLTLLTLQGQ